MFKNILLFLHHLIEVPWASPSVHFNPALFPPFLNALLLIVKQEVSLYILQAASILLAPVSLRKPLKKYLVLISLAKLNWTWFADGAPVLQ